MFFAGKTSYNEASNFSFSFSEQFTNGNSFFIVFAIIFPAFTGMTAGVGLSGDLKNPRKSIPLGTTLATIIGMIVYVFISWKLIVSASPEDLTGDQLIMSKIAIYGFIFIPLGLAASTISSALGSIMVAPRTLQALAADKSFPLKSINSFLSKGKKVSNEPYNASIVTIIIAFVFVIMGDVNAVAQIISMFFMVTYGSLCLISFLNHFGANLSYRPSFRSKWVLSLLGFLMCVWLMFKMNTLYALAAIALMALIYTYISYYHKDRQGLQAIFKSAIFQLNRRLQVFLQKSEKADKKDWKPAAICISRDSFEREEAFNLLNWISYKYGFGTYMHMMEGYFSRAANAEAIDMKTKLIKQSEKKRSNVYIDTIISPSYTSAIAQIVQLPGITGMENNMVIFEYDKSHPSNLNQIIENYALVNAADYDVCVLGSSSKDIDYKKIHVWIRSTDFENSNLMILLSYVILGHPDWRKASIKIFDICKDEEKEEVRKNLVELVKTGRLPIAPNNIEIIAHDPAVGLKSLINEKSEEAALTILGFRGEQLQHEGGNLFEGYEGVGDILFVNSHDEKVIS